MLFRVKHWCFCILVNISYTFYNCHINTAELGLCRKMCSWPSRWVCHDRKNTTFHEQQGMGQDLKPSHYNNLHPILCEKTSLTKCTQYWELWPQEFYLQYLQIISVKTDRKIIQPMAPVLLMLHQWYNIILLKRDGIERGFEEMFGKCWTCL